jgi:hypothetical protein
MMPAMTDYEKARVQVSRASIVAALYEASLGVARLTDAEFLAVEDSLRPCVELLQVRTLPPVAASGR